jgi:hypothetical protein
MIGLDMNANASRGKLLMLESSPGSLQKNRGLRSLDAPWVRTLPSVQRIEMAY